MKKLVTRKILVAGIVFGVIVATVGGILFFNRDTRERAATNYADLLRRQDWGGIYDQAPETELREYSVTRDQYIKFAEVIARGLPPDGWSGFTIDESDKDVAAHERKGVYVVMLKIPFRAAREEVPSKVLIHVHRTPDGWKVSPAGILKRLADLQSGSKAESIQVLLEAMDAADVEYMPVDVNKMVLVRQGLRQYLADNSNESIIFKTR